MVDILLIHPDAALRAALLQTLQNAWSGPDYADCAPDQAAMIITKEQPALFWAASDTLSPDLLAHQAFMPISPGTPMRLHALLHRMATRLNTRQIPLTLSIGDALLDTRSRQWTTQEHVVALTEKEVDTLVYLSHIAEPVSREDLLRDVWEYAAETDTHTIETHIYRLRQKIEHDPANPAYLLTNKQGYYLAARSKA